MNISPTNFGLNAFSKPLAAILIVFTSMMLFTALGAAAQQGSSGGSGSSAVTVYNVTENGTEANYSSIQAAVNEADSNDIIEVAAGTYEESVTVNVQGLTLEGPNSGVHGADESERGEEAVISASADQAVAIDASNVTLDGLQVENNGQNGVRLMSGDNAAIKNTRVTNVVSGDNSGRNGDGITIEPVSGRKVTDTVIKSNYIGKISSSNDDGRAPRAKGVDVRVAHGQSGVSIDSPAIRENVITDVEGGDGLAVGVHMDVNNKSGNITGAVVEDNDVSGLSGKGARGVYLTETWDVTEPETRIGPVDFKIVNNVIYGLNNTEEDDAYSLFIGGYENLGDEHEVRDNALLDGSVIRWSEGQEGYTPSEGDTLDARYNYWGQSTGPEDGQVEGKVEFMPWLLEEDGEKFRVTMNLENDGWSSLSTVGKVTESKTAGVENPAVFTYDGGWTPVDLDSVSHLDAVFVQPGVEAVGFKLNHTDQKEVQLEEGWNFVSVGDVGNASDLFSPVQASLNSFHAPDRYNQKRYFHLGFEENGDTTINAQAIFDERDRLGDQEASPFDGYWLRASQETVFSMVPNPDENTWEAPK